MTENSETPKNNELMNLATSLSAPKPGLVFVCVLVLLNYKFWIIAFGGADAEAKIKLIQTYFAFDFCNLLGKIKEKCFFTNFCANWEVLYNIVLAFIASILYPAVINAVKWFYTKITSKIPTDINEEYTKDKNELKKAKEDLETKLGYKNKEIKLSYVNMAVLLNTIEEDKVLEVSSKLTMIDHVNNVVLPKPTLKMVIFLTLDCSDSNDDSINRYNIFLAIYCLDKDDLKYYRFTMDNGASHIIMAILYQEYFKTIQKKRVDIEYIKNNFSDEIDTFSNKVDIFRKLSINLGFQESVLKNNSIPNAILACFINQQGQLNLQGQLVLAKALHSKIDLLQDLNDKDNILKILNDLRENKETLEEMLDRLFSEEKKN